MADDSAKPASGSSAHGGSRSVAFDLAGLTGLPDAEADRRLVQFGANELPAERSRNLITIMLDVGREPMFLMLVAAGALYLFMGKLSDALMLLGFVFVVMAITIIQERRTERALHALRDLSSPRALVVRGGVPRRIPGREVVPGDIVLVREGDRVPADAVLRRASHLGVDESLLTGESLPVRKLPSARATTLDQPGGDDLPSLFSGTLVVAGQGACEVIATGVATQLGRIGKVLQQIRPEQTPLQTETGRVVRALALVGVCACAVVVVAYALTRGAALQTWREGLLAGIAMAMAVLPEEFPVVLTVFLALGAWRISKNRVLTRRMPAIEALGSATVLCVDKTGTLTENRMTVAKLVAGDETVEASALRGPMSHGLRCLLQAAALASRPQPFDPMERAIHDAARSAGAASAAVSMHLVREYPLSAKLLAVSNAWQLTAGSSLTIAAKGAPEAVAQLCRLSKSALAALVTDITALASEGLRVLGVAGGELAADDLPADQSALSLRFLGLIGLRDPIRPEVPAAVAECHAAGLRVVMITGDYAGTAQSIAKLAGIHNCQTVITGGELERMSDGELAARIRDVQVFARVIPEQKLRIVSALKLCGEIVAMTGDGVNDAPALRSAQIGVAMGGRGTDVARESADLVLLDDSFESIVGAVRLGRRIYDNIRKAITFTIAAHVPIAGLSMIPVFFGSWPLLLLPVHIVFLELIIDPACSLVFEAEEPEANVMRRLPRSPTEKLFGRSTVVVAILQGTSALIVCLAVFVLARTGHSAASARALTFAALVESLIVIILMNRSWTQSAVGALWRPNAALWWVVAGSGVFLGLTLFVAPMRQLFQFGPVHLADLGVSLLAGAACLLWFEAVKRTSWWQRAHAHSPAGR
jgi:Ca2+-transporting ATPase